MAAYSVLEVTPQINICEPHAAWRHEPYDRFQFERTRVDINSASEERRISFSDYALNMHKVTHTIGRQRPGGIPPWAVSDSLFRKLLVQWFLLRSGARVIGPVSDDIAQQKRLLAQAQAAIVAQIPRHVQRLNALCREFVGATDPKEKARLAAQIKHFDSAVMIARRGPALIASIVAETYRRGLNCREVGQELRVTPVFCRQVLHRLGVTWSRMHGIVPQRRRVRSESERAQSRLLCDRIYRAKWRLARTEAKLAALEADRDGYIREAVVTARNIYAERKARAQADVDAARERRLALAKGVL
jgi:hypothetical protein